MADAQGLVSARHEALATEVGTVREVISRQLATFARDGLIEGTRGTIRLAAPDALRAVAGDA